jgi:hypothetical protein
MFLHLVRRGASFRKTRRRWDETAAPAGGLVNPRSGGPGVPVRSHYEGLPSMAGREATKAGQSPPDGSTQKGSRPPPGSAGPGTEIAACGAPGGAFSGSQRRRRRLRTVSRAAFTPAAQGSDRKGPAFPGAPLPSPFPREQLRKRRARRRKSGRRRLPFCEPGLFDN